MARRAAAVAGLLLTGAAPGEVAGPPVSPPERRSAASAAIERYGHYAGARTAARPCRSGEDDIVVCAAGAPESSPYRLPLPEEGGAFDDDRRAMRGNPGPPELGRPGIAPVVRFGLTMKTKF